MNNGKHLQKHPIHHRHENLYNTQEMYKDLVKDTELFKIVYPSTIIPKPSESDYRSGYIRRYFVVKSNDMNSNIFEVSKDVYEQHISNPFWTVASIPWRITGPIDAIIDEDIKKSDKGVRLSNTNAIFLVKDKMPRLALYLPDLIQFHISRRKSS